MGRFEYDDDEEENYFFDTDEENDEADAEYLELMQRREHLDKIQLELVHRDLNQQLVGLNQELLKQAISMCESSFFWRFRSHEKKLQIIRSTYLAMKKTVTLLQPPEEAD